MSTGPDDTDEETRRADRANGDVRERRQDLTGLDGDPHLQVVADVEVGDRRSEVDARTNGT